MLNSKNNIHWNRNQPKQGDKRGVKRARGKGKRKTLHTDELQSVREDKHTTQPNQREGKVEAEMEGEREREGKGRERQTVREEFLPLLSCTKRVNNKKREGNTSTAAKRVKEKTKRNQRTRDHGKRGGRKEEGGREGANREIEEERSR